MKLSSEFVKKVNNKEVKKITFENDNGYVVSFYNFGGYLHSVEIPSNFDGKIKTLKTTRSV